MAPSVALVKIASNTVLPIRIFVNRKQLLQNNSKDTVFHAPLLSNNSIVCIKSPSTRIYLSNNDMRNLTTEIETDILLIIYELASPVALQDVLKKLKMGHTMDWQEDVVPRLFQKSSESLVTSHLQSITRISKFKYKLHFKHNWELDIFIDNIRVLAHIRAYLVFKNEISICPPFAVHSKRKILLNEQVQTPPSLLNEEHSNVPDYEELEEEDKPKLKFKYRPIINLGECINIHVLQRPQRHRKPLAESR
ncbi:related to Single-strand annealing weakened protein 1 [Zygosaccharomyces bailii]|nr:related to Single-strand annealing weakened protein 1 [Zygosaccharomyces bailii]